MTDSEKLIYAAAFAGNMVKAETPSRRNGIAAARFAAMTVTQFRDIDSPLPPQDAGLEVLDESCLELYFEMAEGPADADEGIAP